MISNSVFREERRNVTRQFTVVILVDNSKLWNNSNPREEANNAEAGTKNKLLVSGKGHWPSSLTPSQHRAKEEKVM